LSRQFVPYNQARSRNQGLFVPVLRKLLLDPAQARAMRAYDLTDEDASARPARHGELPMRLSGMDDPARNPTR
jgi:hypothetical protein